MKVRGERDPVFNITFRYMDTQDRDVVINKAVRGRDELQVRLWAQRITAADCKRFYDLKIYKSTTLQDTDGIPHIYDMEDLHVVLAHKREFPYQESSIPKKPEFSLLNFPWAAPFVLIPGKGLGTTKNSINESFYDAAEGAYEL